MPEINDLDNFSDHYVHNLLYMQAQIMLGMVTSQVVCFATFSLDFHSFYTLCQVIVIQDLRGDLMCAINSNFQGCEFADYS